MHETSTASSAFLENDPPNSEDVSDNEKCVLKCEDTFAVVNRDGNFDPRGARGIYHRGTRHLSALRLTFCGKRPVLLSSSISPDNLVLQVDLTNPALGDVREETLHLRRQIMLTERSWHERVRITNHGATSAPVHLRLDARADFQDLFEARGARRPRRGELLPVERADGCLTFRYDGLDDCSRFTRLETSGLSSRFEQDGIVISTTIPAGESREIEVVVHMAQCAADSAPASLTTSSSFNAKLHTAKERLTQLHYRDCLVTCSHPLYSRWFQRAHWDLSMLRKTTENGPFPHAGVPWFSTPFGRDGLLTALQCLWAMPQWARGVLGLLADLQATSFDRNSDAEPGKILHEAREGEMAALGEVPYRRYYGSIDSTPLFVVLAAAYFKTTGDRAFIERLLPHIGAALDWIRDSGDRDQDGFVEYVSNEDGGLVQQGWKDSHDSVFHSDGTAADAPIALCEVQSYVYAAKTGAADIYEAFGRANRARELREEASRLRSRFDEAFWCEDLKTYALALDGAKRPCRVRTSNAGQCLYFGIALPDRATSLAQSLLAPDLFSGWGIRTLSTLERRYNPLSYHNGSMWPHDSAIVAAGLARYGMTEQAAHVFDSLRTLAEQVHLQRLPELICGFPRSDGEPPTLYPVACSPQAWAAAVPFLSLQSLLGLEIDAGRRQVSLRSPRLPTNRVELVGLPVGNERIDLLLERAGRGVRVRKQGSDAVSVAVL